jgi:putative NADH-flavin reductase
MIIRDAVISCLGQRSRQDAYLLRDAAAAALEAMARTGVGRFLVVSQGLLFPSRNPLLKLLRLILARQLADSAAMEQLVRSSGVDWTIVRPPMLQDGGQPRGYRVQRGARPAGAWAMQRADLATFLVDETERHEHKMQIVGATAS